jgi:ribosomal protein L35AE/L33A
MKRNRQALTRPVRFKTTARRSRNRGTLAILLLVPWFSLGAHHVEAATMPEKKVPSRKTPKTAATPKPDKAKPKEKAAVSASKAKPVAKPKAKPAAQPGTKAKAEVKAKAAPAPKTKAAPKAKPKAQPKAKPAAKRPVKAKPKVPTAPAVPAAPPPAPKEIASGVLIGYQRGALRLRLQYGLIRLAGVTTEEQAATFVGRRVLLRLNDRVNLAGRVVGPHGGNGVLRVRFRRGIAPDALAKEVKLF